ncbi:MAG TPA: ribose-phosphate pyrophosphokinase [Thermodesulfobacteriota bacterium]
MTLVLIAGPGHPELARATARALGTEPAACRIERFPDGELHVEVEAHVRGADVYVVQPTSPPADVRLVELLFLADACRLSGAARVTAVVPYLGYARQDRRTHPGEPLGARMVASLIGTAGVDRVVALDLHAAAIESAFPVPVEHLSAVPRLVEAIGREAAGNGVVVSPDLGAVHRAERFARLLDLPMAVVHKTRVGAADVVTSGLTGEVRGRRPIIVDDMISTGGTIEAGAHAMLDAGAEPDIVVAATHAVLPRRAAERLAPLPIRRLVVTDSVEAPADLAAPIERVGVASLLAEAILRLHRGEPVRDLVSRT